jgi:uncharacterized membrane protein YhaH (DUF805 family)
MSSIQKQLEKIMDEYLVKKAPFQIPLNAKKAITSWAPWIALVIGLLSLLSALSLWSLAREADKYIDISYEIGRTYGIESTARDVSTMVYVSIVVLAIQGIILAVAFKGLQEKSKSRGWDLLLLSTLLGFAYSFSTLFISNLRTGTDFIFSLLGALIGLYILAQIKDRYKNDKAKAK